VSGEAGPCKGCLAEALRIAEERERRAWGQIRAFRAVGEESEFFEGSRNAASLIASEIRALMQPTIEEAARDQEQA
jgi:hypothetical protein